MTNLNFEDDQPLGTKPLIASKQCGWLRQVPQLQLANTHPLIEYYMKG